MSIITEAGPIAAAAITGGFAFAGIVWQSRKTRRINTDEHQMNAEKLDRIESKVERTANQVEDLRDDFIRHERNTKHSRRWLR